MTGNALNQRGDEPGAHFALSPMADSALRCVTEDIDEFRRSLNSVFYPAEVNLVGAHVPAATAELSAVRLNHLTIGRARFGNEALVDPGDLGTYHVNVPVTGEVVSWCGDQQTIATPRRAAVFTPNEHTILPLWHADATQICIKIDRAGLEGELAHILGRPVDKHVRFDLEMDLTSPAGARWLSTLKLLLDTLDDPTLTPNPGLIAQIEYLERALISGLLVQQPHSMTAQLYAPGEASKPRAVQKVLDHIETFPGAQYTIGDLAVIAGVGARQLQNLFQEQFGMSPTTYIRQIRLEGVRTDLQHGDGTTRISDVAFSWGFNHLGRFANHYERKFGESPSQTLRAALKSS
ncbi:AraC family transcriptional regulator [Rhodococcus sp. T2V]|uniref:AraC family transcriptional regulator n=1 Tax=Rhodococcus sp. T2V TaxID=3034164 RepID=UPI0023E0EF34|nr:AraC family transcriptional regulator [Rhodococcus sp. T2V]MDF3307546.1 AraC family transcriptional regulator [Rhodococcus sp. T2V]